MVTEVRVVVIVVIDWKGRRELFRVMGMFSILIWVVDL